MRTILPFLALLVGCGSDFSVVKGNCTTTFFPDSDGDGYGDESNAAVLCATDGYVSEGGDCDDDDAAVNPDATETCDGLDNDCDGFSDDDDDAVEAASLGIFYGDSDGDGYGSDDTTVSACAAPSGFTDTSGDCSDLDADVHPDADEVCNGHDDDCDGLVDGDDGSLDLGSAGTWYADADADGYGDPASATTACEAPADTVLDGTDCDDSRADVNPAAVEVCGAADDDCDGAVDDADDSLETATGTTWYADLDGDGWGDTDDTVLACEAPSYTSTADGDCDDVDAAVHPGAGETCNGVDDDCDGDADDDDVSLDVSTVSAWYLDLDSDGYGDAAYLAYACAAPSRYVADATDCNDASARAHPAGTEICDGIDDDCDGDTDEAGAVGEDTFYLDADGDGYGVTGSTANACDLPTGYAENDDDCDDTTASIAPRADEYCDEVDNDCDGSTDEVAVDAGTWYDDDDGDGYGDAGDFEVDCDAPRGHVETAGDCDDLHARVYPGATETCDGTDEDCDGSVDEDDAADVTDWYPDDDGDGYGAGTPSAACEAPTGYVADATDCDDTSADVAPDVQEACNSVDDDCDGQTDEAFWSEEWSSVPSNVVLNGDAEVDTSEGALRLIDDIGEGGNAILVEDIPTDELDASITFELTDGYTTTGSEKVGIFLVDAGTSTDWYGNASSTNFGIVGVDGWAFVVTGSTSSAEALQLVDTTDGSVVASATIGETQVSGPHTLEVELHSGAYTAWYDGVSTLTGTLTGWVDTEYRVGVTAGADREWNRTDIDEVDFVCP